MNSELKRFILGISLFVAGMIGSGLNLISNSITLQADGNNFIPLTMFLVTFATMIVGLVLVLKKKKNN